MQQGNNPTNQLMMHGSIAQPQWGLPKVATIRTSTFAGAQRCTSIQYWSKVIGNQSINQSMVLPHRCPSMPGAYNWVMLHSRILRQLVRGRAYPVWTSSSNEGGTTFDNHSIYQSLPIPTIVVLPQPNNQSCLASTHRSITMSINENPKFNLSKFIMWYLNIKTIIPSYGTCPRLMVIDTKVYNSIRLFNSQGWEAIQS